MSGRKGFVSTLEAVVASTIFFIFIINILPSLMTTPVDYEMTYEVLDNTLDSMYNSGKLRDFVEDEDYESIEEEVETYIAADVAVEIVYEEDHVVRSPEYREDFSVSSSYLVAYKDGSNDGELSFSKVSVYLW